MTDDAAKLLRGALVTARGLQVWVRARWWIGQASDAEVLCHVSRRGGLEGWRSCARDKGGGHLRWFATPLPLLFLHSGNAAVRRLMEMKQPRV
ncbi:antibiotic biosynthesis monooxygenase [Sesbania bispinosa]|nr:antibiotic biosynthesis monooxygenase [Sesbania bispinosa]